MCRAIGLFAIVEMTRLLKIASLSSRQVADFGN